MDDWNEFDAQMIFDLYLLDYMKKRNMHRTATLFNEEANVPPVDVVIDDSREGFLHEWWTIMHDAILSTNRMRNTGAVQPPPISNEEIRQLLKGVSDMIAQPQPPLVIDQQNPMMTSPNQPVVASAKNLYQQQLNNFMPSLRHIHSILPNMIDKGEPDLATTSTSPSATNFTYLQQQPVHNHQIQHSLMTNNVPRITVGENSGIIIQDSISTTNLTSHHEIIPPGAGSPDTNQGIDP